MQLRRVVTSVVVAAATAVVVAAAVVVFICRRCRLCDICLRVDVSERRQMLCCCIVLSLRMDLSCVERDRTAALELVRVSRANVARGSLSVLLSHRWSVSAHMHALLTEQRDVGVGLLQANRESAVSVPHELSLRAKRRVFGEY